MINEQLIKNKTYILGLGQSGMSVARYLERKQQPFIALDTRDQVVGLEALNQMSACQEVRLGKLAEDDLLDARQIIISPGVSPQLAAVKKAHAAGAEVLGDIELFCREWASLENKPGLIAITGSNGKSTVTDLTWRLLKAANLRAEIGGNFGIPVLDFNYPLDSDYYVLELSSFQLDTCHSLEADVAVCLNVTPDHLDRYENFDSYVKSKQNIYRGAKVGLYNAEDPKTKPSLASTGGEALQLFAFATRKNSANARLVEEEGDWLLVVDDEIICRASELQLKGQHNLTNALVALLILKRLGVELSISVVEALKDYQGLSHRFQLIHSANQIDWIDDSKATNTGSTIAALNAIDKAQYETVILIAGGDAKGASMETLTPAINRIVSGLICLGKDKEELMKLQVNCQSIAVDNMQQAVAEARALCQGKSLVLLSPACASLDMYSNYIARGLDFQQQVEAIA